MYIPRSVYSELVCESMGILMFPGIRFFEPNDRFYSWMEANYLKSTPIYDVGAGCGQVSAGLSKCGFKPIALDIQLREDSEYPIALCNGADFPYPNHAVVMLCRPCHGEFPYRVIQNAEESGVTAILYVGLDKNVESDLGSYCHYFQREYMKVGVDGESIWRWNLDEEHQKAFAA